MTPIAFLDANVLVPYDLLSVLLSLADRETLQPRWSEAVLEETQRALISKIGIQPSKASSRISAMKDAFPEAIVTDYQHLERSLRCHPKDRHVFAAALMCEANLLVTANLGDFVDEEAEEAGIELIHPDTLLERILEAKPQSMADALADELLRRHSPRHGAQGLAERLEGLVPRFTERLHLIALDIDLRVQYFWPPEQSISPDEAVTRIRDFLAERGRAGALLAQGFTSFDLQDGVLRAGWDGDATRVEGDLLLRLSPFENLARFVGMPLAFNNEEGRQLREHIDSVVVMGDFGVGELSAKELYAVGTGIEW